METSVSYPSDCLDEEHKIIFLEREDFFIIEVVLIVILGINMCFLIGTAIGMCIKLLSK